MLCKNHETYYQKNINLFVSPLASCIDKKNRRYYKGLRGHCAVYYTSPQSFISTLSYLLPKQLWGLLLNFDWLVH